MHSCDIPQVAEIDREAFPTQWPPINFKRELNNRLANYMVAIETSHDYGTSSYPYIAKSTDRGLQALIYRLRSVFNRHGSLGPEQFYQCVTGYAAFWLMVDEAHITSIAVREECRRQGIGELLLIHLIDLAVECRAVVVTLEVRRSNYIAQVLYQKYGFNRVGLRRAYYSDNREDAVIMTTDPITSVSFLGKFQKLKYEYAELRKDRLSPEHRERLLEYQIGKATPLNQL